MVRCGRVLGLSPELEMSWLWCTRDLAPFFRFARGYGRLWKAARTLLKRVPRRYGGVWEGSGHRNKEKWKSGEMCHYEANTVMFVE